jgi:hypothetical protein
MKMITYTLLCLASIITFGCSNAPKAPAVTEFVAPNQELIVDAKIQSMGRNEVIDAVKQCETNGLRAIPIYAKRKVSGYTVETVVEVTCGPKYPY